MSHSTWLALAMLACSCATSARVAPCPAIAPVTATPVTSPPDSVAIVFVVQGEETWAGNDDIEPEYDPNETTRLVPNPARYRGILTPLKRAFAAADFGSIAVPATAAVITYADQVKVRVPMSPLEEVDAAAFGSQRDYYGQIGRSLVRGVEVGVELLAGSAAARKMLVIIGDGTDTDVEAAAPRLATLRRDLEEARIVTSVIVYRGPLSEPVQLLRDWHDLVNVVSEADLEHVFARIKRRATSAGRPRCETC